jgi:hypothetical protein
MTMRGERIVYSVCRFRTDLDPRTGRPYWRTPKRRQSGPVRQPEERHGRGNGPADGGNGARPLDGRPANRLAQPPALGSNLYTNTSDQVQIASVDLSLKSIGAFCIHYPLRKGNFNLTWWFSSASLCQNINRYPCRSLKILDCASPSVPLARHLRGCHGSGDYRRSVSEHHDPPNGIAPACLLRLVPPHSLQAHSVPPSLCSVRYSCPLDSLRRVKRGFARAFRPRGSRYLGHRGRLDLQRVRCPDGADPHRGAPRDLNGSQAGGNGHLAASCDRKDRPCRARPADRSLVAQDRSAAGVGDQTGPEPSSVRAESAAEW